MSEISENEVKEILTDDEQLTKPKKGRAKPRTDKQLEQFEKVKRRREENIERKKREKLLESAKLLIEENRPPKKVKKEKVQPPSESEESESEEEIIIKKKSKGTKQVPLRPRPQAELQRGQTAT
jgi:hypothetical protein